MQHNKQNRQTVKGEKRNEGKKKESRNADTEEGVVWKETTRAKFVPDNCNGNLSLADKYGQTEVSLCVSVGRSLGGSGIQAELGRASDFPHTSLRAAVRLSERSN